MFDGKRPYGSDILLMEVKLTMNELKSLRLCLAAQKKRLAELVEISGGEDPHHPLQAYSIRRIAWLENRIREEQERAAH